MENYYHLLGIEQGASNELVAVEGKRAMAELARQKMDPKRKADRIALFERAIFELQDSAGRERHDAWISCHKLRLFHAGRSAKKLSLYDDEACYEAKRMTTFGFGGLAICANRFGFDTGEDFLSLAETERIYADPSASAPWIRLESKKKKMQADFGKSERDACAQTLAAILGFAGPALVGAMADQARSKGCVAFGGAAFTPTGIRIQAEKLGVDPSFVESYQNVEFIAEAAHFELRASWGKSAPFNVRLEWARYPNACLARALAEALSAPAEADPNQRP